MKARVTLPQAQVWIFTNESDKMLKLARCHFKEKTHRVGYNKEQTLQTRQAIQGIGVIIKRDEGGRITI